ncbi:MAG TPA: cation diffusion facilitator family transporter, partial [Candidatus Elarobacter sp.]|nr:cation diffusion facilitator family transporter [Candidatus Elarobacter sp.]
MTGHAAGSTARLKVALAAAAGVAVVELAGGIRAGSLALMSDAAHVAMDVVALAIALAAAVQSKRPATHRQTYGFARYGILAALANGGLLTAVTVLIAVEAVRRLAHPELPAGGLMAGVAAVGLVVNVAVGLMLSRDRHRDLNVRAALLHVAGDALGALAVIAGGALILWTGAAWIDPVLSLLVAALIVAGIAGVVREATAVLLESAPGHAEIPAVRDRIGRVEGVVGVHDLHVWTI